MEEEINKIMEMFDLNENQAKVWNKENYGSRDKLIKYCWKEAQKEFLETWKKELIEELKILTCDDDKTYIQAILFRMGQKIFNLYNESKVI